MKKDAEDRREEILAATLAVIAEAGINGLRGSDIAKRLGVSTALIFYHFETLENLLLSAFRFATDRDLARLEDLLVGDGASHVDRLRGALTEYGPTGTGQNWRLWIEGWSAGLRNTTLRATMRTLDNRWREVVAVLIADGVRAGEFRADDPRGTAWRLTALLDGLAVQRIAFDDTVTQSDMDEWLEVALHGELGIAAASNG